MPNLPSSRPPLARMLRIHQLLSRGETMNCPRVAAAWEVSSKTIQRDVEFMREQLGLPITYDAARHSFSYAAPVSATLLDAVQGSAQGSSHRRREVFDVAEARHLLNQGWQLEEVSTLTRWSHGYKSETTSYLVSAPPVAMPVRDVQEVSVPLAV